MGLLQKPHTIFFN